MNFDKAIAKCFGIMNRTFSEINGLDWEEFQMYLGVMIDQYQAEHGKSFEETQDMLERLIGSRAMVQAVCRDAPKIYRGN